MDGGEGRLTVPEVVGRFRSYPGRDACWGPLHVALDDGNLGDDDVQFCRRAAQAEGDAEAVALADLLLRMSRTQRRRLYRRL